jgi:multidrug efflux pump subunit AcrA (membrane-fusion protein)
LFVPGYLAGRNKGAADISETTAFSVRTQAVSRQTLNVFINVNGDIVCTQQTDVFPDVGGILVSVQATLGSYVSKGDVIAEVDPSRPGTTFLNSPVVAPISGIISKTPLSRGSTVGLNTSITAISLNQNLEINARIPEREIAGLRTGLVAEVSIQAYPGETFTATVNRVSPVVDSISRTKLINLRFNREDQRINSGMFARVKINTRSYPDVLAVPAEAVITSRGANVVYVVEFDEDQHPIAARREVNCGVSLQGWTEILTGLAEGETVIVQGQQLLSGGEALRIIGDVQ